ncbi:MAG: PhnB protein [Solirubrobacteraceae bacterium]|jgi:PhnB protein|nr:PhnB protein [Solirubrobacteraceae bacterium]
MSHVRPIPEGYHTVTPFLAVDDASAAIEFYERAFGARERARIPMPDGKVAHAELELGDSVIMLADPFPQAATRPPKELGGTTVGVFLYVEDVDGFVQRAVDAGATVTMAPEDMFWGDRFGQLTDPFGHQWQVATHIEDVPAEEMAARAREAMSSMG